MRNFIYGWIASLGLLVVACQKIDKSQLLGTWKAVAVIDAGDTIAADLTHTRLALNEDDEFTYQQTTREVFSGSFQLQRDILSMLNNTAKDTFRVQVLEVDSDHLKLRMNHEGTERLVVFAPEKQEM